MRAVAGRLARNVIVPILHVLVVMATASAGVLLVRPLYDGAGYSPPPYRWVERPPGLSGANEPPTALQRTVDVLGGPAGLTVRSEDGQVVLVLLEGGVEPPSEGVVEVSIEPVAPGELAPPPAHMRFDSNAYRIEVTDPATGDPVPIKDGDCAPDASPKVCPTLMLRYALRGTDILMLQDGAWETLPTTPIFATLQVFGDIPRFGTFVVVGPEAGTSPERPDPDRLRPVLAIALAISAALNAWMWRRRGAERTASTEV